MKVTVEIRDYSQPKKTPIRVYNSWCNGDKVELQIGSEYYTVNADELISAVQRARVGDFLE